MAAPIQGNSSGTYGFNPSVADLLIESFERCGIRSSVLTPEHMYSARMSANLLLSSWANRGVNLWKVTLQSVPLVQGVATYSVPKNTIMMLDAYVRQYSMNGPVNLTPLFTTTLSQPTVSINYPNHGLSVGNWINVVIYTSVGGLIIYGFYQVTSVTDVNNFVINVGANATSGATGGGVPSFTTTPQSSTVTVTLNNHGFVAGGTFVIQTQTNIGGISLFGSYTIIATPTANTFTFTASYAASTGATVSENSGLTQIAGQNTSAQLIDRILGTLSRTDYASQPNKQQQGFPTQYWYDRLINQNFTLWQVPDGNGPYEVQYYSVTQIMDADAVSGQTPDIPYRFLEAFSAEFAWHLSRKWAPALSQQLKIDAQEAWAQAAAEDRELVPFYVGPDLSGYFQ